MSQSEPDFVNFVLDTVSHDVKKLGDLSNDLLDSLDRHVNLVAESLRDALHGSTWIPSQIKPLPPPPPPSTALHNGYLNALAAWISRHRAVTAAAVAFVSTGAFLIWRQRSLYRRTRRAKRAASGAKTEVVVLAGSPYAPLTRSIAVDLDHKGFLVFIPVTSIEEETAIAEFQSADVRPLNFDITSENWSSALLESFSSYLANPQRHGTKRLHLSSLILLEAYLSTHPAESIHTLSTQQWSDTLNTHVLYPISLINTFLPLLYSQQQAEGRKKSPNSIVLLTSSAALAPQLPGHATQAVASASLHSYIQSLQAELPQTCQVAHIRLGAISFHTAAEQSENPVRRKWANMYQKNGPRATKTEGSSHHSKGVNKDLKDLQNAVFDAAAGRVSGTLFVGRGARTYALIGSFAPASLVEWMRGQRMEQPLPSATLQPANRTASKSQSSTSSDNDSIGRSIEWEKVVEG